MEKEQICVGCNRETIAFYSPSLGWYCGQCKSRWAV